MAQEPQKGNFDKKIEAHLECSFSDFSNPWNFYKLFLTSSKIQIHTRLRDKGLLMKEYVCTSKSKTGIICGRKCKLVERSNKDGFSFRCPKKHEFAIRKNSIFEGSQYSLQELVHFFKLYLDRNLLIKISEMTGMKYKTTAIEWAKLMRRIYKQYVYNHVHGRVYMKLSGTVEVDESLFGRCVKDHKGNPHVGVKVPKINYLNIIHM